MKKMENFSLNSLVDYAELTELMSRIKKNFCSIKCIMMSMNFFLCKVSLCIFSYVNSYCKLNNADTSLT